MFGELVGGIATLSRSRSACLVPVKFWKPGISPGRDAGEQDRQQVGPVGVERGQVREHARVQHRQQRCELGALNELGEVRVVGWTRCVPLVLAAHRHDDLVEQRVARAARPGRTGRLPVSSSRRGRGPSAGWPRPRRRSSPSDPQGRWVGGRHLVRSVIGTWIAIVCTFSWAVALTPGAGGSGHQVEVLERPQRAEVEDRAEVDVEALDPLAGEDLPPVGSVWIAALARST